MRVPGLSLSPFPATPPDARVASIDEGEMLRLRALVDRLAGDLATARYELEQMKARHEGGMDRLILAFGLTRGEAKFLAVLAARGEVSREGMDVALYGGDARGNKVLDVWLCKVRSKVEGLEIETIQGWGWRISDESRARIRAVIGEDA